MTKKDIDTIIEILCPNDEDFEKPIISPQYLKQELEQLALEQEPCGDTVSAVMHILAELGYGDEENGADAEYMSALCDVAEKVKALSPVILKPKTGHWVKYATPRCGEQHYKCTNCDDYVNFGQYGDYYTKDFKFCPHCGFNVTQINNPTKNEDEIDEDIDQDEDGNAEPD